MIQRPFFNQFCRAGDSKTTRRDVKRHFQEEGDKAIAQPEGFSEENPADFLQLSFAVSLEDRGVTHGPHSHHICVLAPVFLVAALHKFVQHSSAKYNPLL